MLLVSISNIPGTTLTNVHGLVSSEIVLGQNFIKDFMASVTDVVGGRSLVGEKMFRKAKELALKQIIRQAEGLGANAILGVDFEVQEISGKDKAMMMVMVFGTAVNVEIAKESHTSNEKPMTYNEYKESDDFGSDSSLGELDENFKPKTKYNGW